MAIKQAAKKVAAPARKFATKVIEPKPVPKAKPAPVVDITKEVQAAAKSLAPAIARLNKALTGLNPSEYAVGTVCDMLGELNDVAKLVPNLNAQFHDILDPTIKVLEEHFVKTLAVGEASGVQGMRRRVQVSESVVPTVDNWPKLYAHILKTKSFDLLNRAVNRAAVAARWDAKKQVPGVGKFNHKKVSVTKLRGK